MAFFFTASWMALVIFEIWSGEIDDEDDVEPLEDCSESMSFCSGEPGPIAMPTGLPSARASSAAPSAPSVPAIVRSCARASGCEANSDGSMRRVRWFGVTITSAAVPVFVFTWICWVF